MGDDGFWRTPAFRQSVVSKIEEAIRQSGMSTSRNSLEMENHVFQKARTKEEYLGYVARLILHVREMSSKKGTANGVPGTNQGALGVPDPINTLQTLAIQGTCNPLITMDSPQQEIITTNVLQTLNRDPGQTMNLPGPNGGPLTNQMGNQMGGQISNQMANNGINQMPNQMGNQSQMGNLTPNQFLRQSPYLSVQPPAGLSNAPPSNQMVPFPALAPSSSSHMSMLGTTGPPSSVGMIPTPGSSRNTSGQPNQRPMEMQDEQAYEKVRQLSEYIEPFRKMIMHIGNDGEQSSTMDLPTIYFSEDLKCSLCTNLLSYFPIYMSTSNANICGRCAPPQESTSFRNSVYESVSQFLQFPCRYKCDGCVEALLPKDIPQHEKACFYRIIKCPIYTHCNWEGSRPKLMKHCYDDHADLFWKNGDFEMDLTHFSEGLNLLLQDDMLLIVQRKFNQIDKMLQCAVYHLENETKIKNYSCQLIVESGNRNVSVDFYTTNFEDIYFTELDLESLKSQSSIVSGKITIGEIVTEDKEKTNLDMLSVLKCSLCSDFAIPPIHQCVNDQSTICSNCKQRHESSCNDCLGSAITRNIGLDKIASLLNYPCKNQKNGCNVMGKPNLVKNHQEFCQYGRSECPLNDFMKCEWQGYRKDIVTHVDKVHQSLIMSPKEEICRTLLPRKMSCNLIKYANQIFRVVYAEANGRFYWSVQMVGRFNPKFKYEIEIIDRGGTGEKISLKQTCGPLVKCKQFMKNDRYYCYLHSDQVKRLLSSPDTVAFKVHIFKS